MFFKKNKIKESLKNVNDNTTNQVDAEFESLVSVKKYHKDHNLANRIFVKPIDDAKLNLQDKKVRTQNYFKQNYWKLAVQFFILFFLATLTLASWIVFNPFAVTPNGDYSADISNFWIAKNGSISGITVEGLVLVIMLLITIVLGIYSFFVLKKRDSLILKKTKKIKILNIFAYSCIATVFLLVVILCFIPPPIFSANDYQQIWTLRTQIEDATSESEKLTLINKLNDLIKDSVPSIKPIASGSVTSLEQYEVWIQDSTYLTSTDVSAYSILYKSSLNSNDFTLSIAGIIIVVLFTILGAVGFIALPITIYFLYTIQQVKEDMKELNDEIKENWDVVKKIIAISLAKSEDLTLKGLKKVKNHETYGKYKKRLSKEGKLSKRDDEFTTDVSQVKVQQNSSFISMAEIESNPPNTAFLSKNGYWMYHDGNHNVYITRGDEWVPFDINKDIHIAHAQIVDETLNLSPSEKKAKERKISFSKNKESAIALPDQEIDDIVKNLDI